MSLMCHSQKSLALRLREQGVTMQEIARQVACTRRVVHVMVNERRWLTGQPDAWSPRQGGLTLTDREEIFVGLRMGKLFAQIARELDPPRSTSTVSREVGNNGGREEYSIWQPHDGARAEARRPKTAGLVQGPLLELVTAGWEQLWSPQAISKRLRSDFPDDPDMWVSHETIYQSLFVQGRGELRRELARCLRSGRTHRRPQGTVDGRGRIPAMINISERPAEAADRSVPG